MGTAIASPRHESRASSRLSSTTESSQQRSCSTLPAGSTSGVMRLSRASLVQWLRRAALACRTFMSTGLLATALLRLAFSLLSRQATAFDIVLVLLREGLHSVFQNAFALVQQLRSTQTWSLSAVEILLKPCPWMLFARPRSKLCYPRIMSFGLAES